MKILQLCHKPPRPAKDGGCIAMNNITEGLLGAGHEVKILTIHTHKHNFEVNQIEQEYLDSTQLESVFVDTRINLVDAFSNLITQDSYNVSRFFSADFDMKLQAVLSETSFDVVILESLFMTPYLDTIRRWSKSLVILRSHNLEYVIWERVARGSRNPAKKSYLKLLAKQLKKYELNVFKSVDGIVAISSVDEKKYRQLGYAGPITTVPFGIDTKSYNFDLNVQPELSLFHLGSMDWTPNIEGVLWFLEKVWPEVQKANLNIRLYLAGREMPQEIYDRKDPNVVVVGEVPDAHEFIGQHGIMVVPLLSAGGIRVKIIEGMALGKTIISTTIGAEGIEYENGKQILIADEPHEFVKAMQQLTKKPEQLLKIGKNARELVYEQFENTVLTKKLIDFFVLTGKRS